MAAVLDIQTATMARVFAEQGHYEKAAEIYRNLLKQEPQRRDLVEALSEIEKRTAETGTEPNNDLVSLFDEWIGLAFRYKRLRDLMTFKKRMRTRLSE